MSVDWSILAGLAGGVLAFVGYVAKKYVDLRLDLVQQFHGRKFEAVAAVRGLLAEVDHAAMHLHRGEERYREVLEQHCASVRKLSREQSAVVGGALVSRVREATDVALSYASDRTDALRARWVGELELTLEACDALVSRVELRPSRRGRPSKGG